MNIGEKIRQLRQLNNVTQEKLADSLSISSQSVSKWETGGASPDVSLIVPIANFFGVTTDELFDHTANTVRQELQAFAERDMELMVRPVTADTISERVSLARSMVAKYPTNCGCLRTLASALSATVDPELFDDATIQSNGKEAVEICERLLRDEDNRECAIQELVSLYSCPHLSFADERMAVKYAQMSGSIYTCCEVLLERAYFTADGKEQQRSQRHLNTGTYLDFLCHNMEREARELPPEEAVDSYETIRKLVKLIIQDGNYLSYYHDLAEYSMALAKNYALLCRKEETLSALTEAIAYSDANDAIPVGTHYFTGPFLNGNWFIKSYPDEYLMNARRFLTDVCFDIVRDTPAFIQLSEEPYNG